MEALRKDILEHVIRPVVPAELLDEQTKYYVNPTGRFVVGGPQGDSGLTGRKIIVDTFGTGAADEAAIEAAVEQVFDLRPASIIEQLGLRRPIYRQLAAYGHMGREELGVAWEQTDKAGALRAAMGL